MQQVGQKKFESYFENFGGLNLTDSTFAIQPNQATGGSNFEYVKTGGIQKSLCASRINAVADSQLKTLGLFLRHTQTGVKSIIRAAGTKIQSVDLIGNFTNLTQDVTSANTDFLSSSSSQPVVGTMFVTPSVDSLWLAGGGMDKIYGVVSNSLVSANGVVAPTGSFSATEQIGGGSFGTAGTYYYALAFRKRSTQALSNAALDVSVTLASATNSVLIDWSTLTNIDTTLYDKVFIYRSAVNGATAFTAGNLAAQVDITSTSYTDTGTNVAVSAIVPREGNTLLDNSTLPSGTYKTCVTFKRRLATAKGSTVYLSDLNKPESWPTTNVITIPSGGEILGLAKISFTPNAASTDEFLAVFKETELWVISGSSSADWELKFVDNTGCLGQSLVSEANGYLYFVDNRGFYLWDGVGKPFYISRLIESLFGVDGKLDLAKLGLGSSVFFKRQNQIVWYLSHADIGEQKFILKLDLRLTLPQVKTTLAERILDGVFIPGKVANPVYASASFTYPTSSSQETLLITGDSSGYVSRQFYTTTGVGSNDYDFSYETNHLNCGTPQVNKQFYQVVAWVEDLGNWDLLLDYWTDYRTNEDDKHTATAAISIATSGTTSLWDIGKWDEAKWDGYVSKPRRIVFNLNAQPYNNSVGEVIKLRFRNQNSDEPVTILGFGIYYTEIGVKN